jgi:hypothetical protein
MRAIPFGPAMRDPRRSPLGRALARLAGAAIWLACAGGAHAQGAAADGTAAGTYVLGFIQYVRWPGEESIAAWQVCTPAAAGRAAAYGGRTARGKPVAVRPVAAGDSLAGCQILDLTDAPAASAKALLAQARKQPILTVGESSAFCTAGGTVCLRGGDAASGFEINLSAVQDAGLAVNAQLLMLGRKRETARGGQ